MKLVNFFLIHKLYGLYKKRKILWDQLYSLCILKGVNVILGRDLSLTIKNGEVWAGGGGRCQR
jgi:hypothetical protein